MRRSLLCTLCALPFAVSANWEAGVEAFRHGDNAAAIREFRESAEQGHVGAQVSLGYMYAVGRGVPANRAEAEKWYRLAAAQGDTDAQYRLGRMYDPTLGDGADRDPEEAVKWFQLAAERGHSKAQLRLGMAYSGGELSLLPQDDVEAAKWFRLAAEQNDRSAQFLLGVMYDKGEGVPEDDVEAVKWFRLAAEQGHADAQGSLGIMYANGQGVPENDAEAVKWFERSAKQGSSLAQVRLGSMYALGQGVSTDVVTAYAWWSRAAVQEGKHSVAASELMDLVRPAMTPEQVLQAQQRGRDLALRTTDAAADAVLVKETWQYVDPNGLFHLSVPKSWQLLEYDEASRGKVLFEGPDDIELRVLAKPVNYTSLDAIIEHSGKIAKSLGIEIEYRKTKLNRFPALRRRFSYRGDNYLAYDILHGGYSHNLQYAAPPSSFPVHVEAILEVLGTYQPGSP